MFPHTRTFLKFMEFGIENGFHIEYRHEPTPVLFVAKYGDWGHLKIRMSMETAADVEVSVDASENYQEYESEGRIETMDTRMINTSHKYYLVDKIDDIVDFICRSLESADTPNLRRLKGQIRGFFTATTLIEGEDKAEE